LEPANDPEAIQFVHNLLAERPAKPLTIQAVFKVRPSRGPRTQIPVTYSVHLTGTNWQSVYDTARTDFQGPENLVINHLPDAPNQYHLTQISLNGAKKNSLDLPGAEANLSFAGTDFWLSDLGLEFLHWPQQRMVRDAKIKMRFGRPCKVIESINPHPTAGNYARVVSWIDDEFGSLIRAQAYDIEGKPFKFFSLESFKKVNGRWQVKDMEIRDEHTDSRTVLEFSFESE
jgi:hypothetical protein